MCVPPVVHNVRYESYECTTGGTRQAERVKKWYPQLQHQSNSVEYKNAKIINQWYL